MIAIGPQNESPTGIKWRFPWVIVIVLLVCLVLVGAIFFAYNFFTTPSPIPLSPAVSQDSPNTSFYGGSKQGYSFRYLTSWKIDSQGTLAVLVNLNNPSFQDCAAEQAKIINCDAAVSAVPYAENVFKIFGIPILIPQSANSRSSQAKKLAVQLAIYGSTAPILLNQFTGYEIASADSIGISPTNNHSYYVLLEGSKNMILIQFPYDRGAGSLNTGQQTILNSILEQ